MDSRKKFVAIVSIGLFVMVTVLLVSFVKSIEIKRIEVTRMVEVTRPVEVTRVVFETRVSTVTPTPTNTLTPTVTLGPTMTPTQILTQDQEDALFGLLTPTPVSDQ